MYVFLGVWFCWNVMFLMIASQYSSYGRLVRLGIILTEFDGQMDERIDGDFLGHPLHTVCLFL